MSSWTELLSSGAVAVDRPMSIDDRWECRHRPADRVAAERLGTKETVGRVNDEAIRLLIVDDHAVVRLGMTALLRTDPGILVVGKASDANEAVEAAARLEPDVIVMDVRLPDGSGVDACREIRSARPAARVLMLTSHDDGEAVISAVMAGAAGYVLKGLDPAAIIDAIRIVARGGSMLDPAVTSLVLDRLRRAGEVGLPNDPLGSLTDSERVILRLIAEGQTNREIAAALDYSEHTVKSYVRDLLHKLRMHRRSEAAAFLVRNEHLAS